ncbi:MAG TPA: SCP2 sterol-binding domain-containing protein [Spongiibacteraceae bacterium]|jgi:putative sterol carrier protein
MSSIEEVTSTLAQKLATAKPFGKKIKFSLDGNTVFLDGTTNPPAVSNEDNPSDVTITATLEDFVKIMNKQLNAQMAFMSGKLKLQGDMMAAMALGSLF